jgi:hypothetical protein
MWPAARLLYIIWGSLGQRDKSQGGARRLNPVGIRRLSAKIRAAQRERSDHIRSWLAIIAPIIGALTGLIGALIGLLAVILGRR